MTSWDEHKYAREPGYVYEYIEINDRAFAKIRTAFEGVELWRSRKLYGKEVSCLRHRCADMDEFIEYVRPLL